MTRRTAPLLAALMLAALSYAVTQTLLVPALPGIRREYETNAIGATALVSVFFVSGAVTAGVVGRLGDMFGKRRLLVAELALFSFGAILCAIAPTLPLLLAGRVVMGTGLAIFPLSFAIVRDVVPPPRVPSAVVLIAGTGGAGAALGQACGGVITDHLGYQAVFWFGALAGVVSLLAVVLLVPESPLRTPGRVDFAGAALLGLAVGGPLIAISQTPTWGWGGTPTLGLIAAGLAVAAIFVRHERRQREPLLDLETIKSRPVALTNAVTLLTGFSMFGAAVIITQFLQEPESTGYGFGASATEAGLLLMPGYLTIMLVAPLAGRLSSSVGPKATLVAGCGMASLGLALLASTHGHWLEVGVWLTVLYLGVGFASGAAPTLMLEQVPPRLSGQSTATNLVFRNIGTAIGTQIAATFVVAATGASGLPAESGYTHAFALAAFVAGLACLLGTAIPGRPRAGGRGAEPIEGALQPGV